MTDDSEELRLEIVVRVGAVEFTTVRTLHASTTSYIASVVESELRVIQHRILDGEFDGWSERSKLE